MTRSVRILIAGFPVAFVVLVSGLSVASRFEHKAAAAGVCDLPVPAEEDTQASTGDTVTPAEAGAHLQEEMKAVVARWLAAGNKSTGDPDADIVLAETEAKKADAKRIADCRARIGKVPDEAEIRAVKRWSRTASAIIAILCAIPWMWYFLLRRVSELRAAIAGMPPNG